MGLYWDDLRYLLAVHRFGNASVAASKLRVSHTTVSRRITDLEKQLNVKLIDRSGLAWIITPLGNQLAELGQDMEASFNDAQRVAHAFSHEIGGIVRISAPAGTIASLLAPALRDFRLSHPEVRLAIQSEDDIIDLSARKADIAVRFTNSPDINLIGETVSETAWAFYATEQISRNITSQLDEAPVKLPLAPLLTSNQDCTLPDWAKGRFHEDCPCDFVYGYPEKVALAAEGFGVTMLPRIMGDAHAGLQRISKIPCNLRTKLWVLANSDTRTSKRIGLVKKNLITGIKKLKENLDPDTN